MLRQPRISIVIPSFNQGSYLGETLESLTIQNYPNLEVVVQEAGSSDDSLRIAHSYAKRHPDIFKIFVERDNGQAQGLNLGFKKATGTILGFLNADDTLMPGCLERVAKEIDPEQSRFIVMGRCLFVGEGAAYVGIEHPCEFTDHFTQLAIWKRGVNTIPQPSVFWHRTVWEKCGGFDETQQHTVDYELFCRFSKSFSFQKVDELWSTYRIHSSSKTFTHSEQEVMDFALQASRKHWGPWWSFLRWRCETSFWFHNPEKFERARHHARLAEEASAKKEFAAALQNACVTFGLSPKLALNRLGWPVLLNRVFPLIERSLLSEGQPLRSAALRYPDGWIGPNLAEIIQIPIGTKTLQFLLEFLRPRPIKTRVDFLVDGQLLRSSVHRNPERFAVALAVQRFAGRSVTLEILSSSSFTPSHHGDSEDHRKLSLIILDQRFE
jgi:glycosyltransferase involved in cell wall biosynthesis